MNEKRMQALFLRDFSFFLEQKRRMRSRKARPEQCRSGFSGVAAYRMKFVMGRRGFSGCRMPAALPASMHWSSQAMLRPSSCITAQPSSSCRTCCGVGAVDHGPVGAVDQRHVEELRVFDQLVQRGGGAAAAGRTADGGRLVGQILAARVAQAVHKAGHVAGGRGIVHRAAEDEGVGGSWLFRWPR